MSIENGETCALRPIAGQSDFESEFPVMGIIDAGAVQHPRSGSPMDPRHTGFKRTNRNLPLLPYPNPGALRGLGQATAPWSIVRLNTYVEAMDVVALLRVKALARSKK